MDSDSEPVIACVGVGVGINESEFVLSSDSVYVGDQDCVSGCDSVVDTDPVLSSLSVRVTSGVLVCPDAENVFSSVGSSELVTEPV